METSNQRNNNHILEKVSPVCPICRDAIDKLEDQFKLNCKCQTSYHYECIYLSHCAEMKQQYNNIYNPRKCPYCKTCGGFLPLNSGYQPVLGVNYIKPRREDDIGFGLANKCQEIIVSKNSSNCGNKCNQPSYNLPICMKHRKKYVNFLVDFYSVVE